MTFPPLTIGEHEYSRRLYRVPGYDCRQRCEHEKRGNHGIRNDSWWLVLARDRGAVSLEIASRYCKGKPQDPRSAGPRWLSLHLAFPTTPDQFFGEPRECDYVGGACFDGTISSLDADKAWPSEEDIVPDTLAKHRVWNRLAEWFEAEYARAITDHEKLIAAARTRTGP